MPPANSVRIAPYPERCFFLGIGPNPKDVTVEILDLHFQGPLEMVWRISDFCARDRVSCVKRSNILQAYPHPHPWLALIVVRQKYGALLAGHAGKSIPSPPSQIKTKSLDAIRNTGIHVLDSKDGQGRTEIVLHGFCQTENNVNAGARRFDWSAANEDRWFRASLNFHHFFFFAGA